MEIEFIYVPLLACLLFWFLGWMFSGFSDGLEGIAGNPITLVCSIIGYILCLICLAYYPIKLIMWIYDNITIT